ncbi:MAG: 50S ribosomal protein L16 [Planctomycetota bacterium]|jgi:large subunit ribosomal protein L16
MALMPKRVEHRKFQRKRIRGEATRGNYVCYGEYDIQAMEAGWITSAEIEAARVTANRCLAGQAKIYIRIFPHRSATARPAETRMGKGKGDVVYWRANVKPGTILYEIGGVAEDAAREAFRRQAHKLSVKTRFAKRRHSL